MAIVLPREESLGEALGTGLGQGLQILLSQQLQNIASRKQAQGLQSLGIEPGMAQQLSQLDPSILREVVKERVQAPSQQAFAEALGALLGHPASPEARGLDALPGIVSGAEQQEAALPSSAGDSATPLIPRGLKAEQAVKLAEIAQKQRGEARKEAAEIFKLNQKEIQEIRSKSKAAKEQVQDLNRLIELDKTGKLDSATYDAFLRNSGFDIAALRSPESQEYNKIVNNFVKNAKDIFGARISNFELEQFMQTLPSLSQSPEGRKRVVANMQRIARSNEEYGKQLNKLLKENKGRLPADFLVKIDDAVDKKLDKFAQQFKKDLGREVPAAESPSKVAAGAAVGRALPVAAGAVPGFLLGGPAGAAIGAGAGAAFPSILAFLSRLRS